MILHFTDGVEKVGVYIQKLARKGYEWVNYESELKPGTYLPGEGLETLLVFGYADDNIYSIINDETELCWLKNESGRLVYIEEELIINIWHFEDHFIDWTYFLNNYVDVFRN